jgi:hypothetical protein
MAESCFIKKDSSPPVCGVHNVRLIRKQLPVELIASGYKGFTFLVCPVSGAVLNDEATHK